MRGFKQFLLRGNVIDLAVAVVIGAAFGAVVSSFVKDLLTPLVAAIFGKPDFSNLYFTVNNSRFSYGNFVNTLIAFLLIGAAVYYFVVLPVNALAARSRREAPAVPETQKCPECLSDIPVQARRCAFCATALLPVSQRKTGT
ncbi:MAG: large conductance mechanosensitive channel protein MscL [Oligoflexia bacterium]|nr:large conductance mechanosensitive channel protein MscL [Oligoflexia bacterium]